MPTCPPQKKLNYKKFVICLLFSFFFRKVFFTACCAKFGIFFLQHFVGSWQHYLFFTEGHKRSHKAASSRYATTATACVLSVCVCPQVMEEPKPPEERQHKDSTKQAELAFKLYDKDKDGYITKSEMEKLSKTLTKEQIEKVFARSVVLLGESGADIYFFLCEIACCIGATP